MSPSRRGDWDEKNKPSDLSKMEEEDVDKIPEVAVSRDFALADSTLVLRFKRLKAAYEKRYPGRKMECICTYRSPKEQARLYAKGRFGSNEKQVTWVDGKIKKSKHNHMPSRAIDFGIFDGGKYCQDEEPYWPIGAILKADGIELEWAGWWKYPKIEYCHVELPDPEGK